MSIPGMEKGFYTTTGLEHNETGKPTYTPENRNEQSAKRLRKLETALHEITDCTVIGPENAEIGIISWGSTTGAAVEAAELAADQGIAVKVFKTIVLWPLPQEAIIRFADSVRKIIVPEMNQQGQFANLLHFLESDKIVRANWVTGVPVSPMDIAEQIKKVHGAL
jgi:2-oxoglutarate ferredoxin oxidoreductase subunit alpha